MNRQRCSHGGVQGLKLENVVFTLKLNEQNGNYVEESTTFVVRTVISLFRRYTHMLGDPVTGK